MRDNIKFRAWHKELKRMRFHYTYLRSDDGVALTDIGGPFTQLEVNKNLIPMLSIGLRDKKGVEIYEGDIVTFRIKAIHKSFTGTVTWNQDFAGFGITGEWNEMDWVKIIHSVEIIGNIYENPELMEEHRHETPSR